MNNTMVIRDKKSGKKMYPVGRWETHQHIFYNYSDRCHNRMVDEDYSEDSINACDEAERFLGICDTNIVNGMIYAVYEDYKKMKDIIGAYAVRHGGAI